MRFKKVKAFVLSVVIAFFALSSSQVFARDLVVGLKMEPTSMDPQLISLLTNLQVSEVMFDTLVGRDANMGLVPRLALSWQAQGNDWIFNLRPNVKFSDGSAFTADDVVFTVNRIFALPNRSFAIYLPHFVSVEAVDPLTVKFTLSQPTPLLPHNLTAVFILSEQAMSGGTPEGKTTTQLNSGDGLVGTGAYRFISWQRGAELVFEPNIHYWGSAPEWNRLRLRPIPNGASRVAALLSGEVDLIEDPPGDDLARLRDTRGIRVVIKGPTNRTIFLGLDMGRDDSPGISGTNGVNPLKDRRVREALSLAINRQALDERIMNGMATPAAQMLPYPMFGTSERYRDVPPADVERARALLAEAGFAQGFGIVLSTPNGRYINDTKVAEAIAAMWSRIGVRTTVNASVMSVFLSKAHALEYSAYIYGWGPLTGEISNTLVTLAATHDKAQGMGTNNWGRYSNPAVDRLLEAASAELDDNRRAALMREAGELVMADYALLPIHFEHSSWAMKDTVNYEGRMDQMTIMQDVFPVH